MRLCYKYRIGFTDKEIGLKARKKDQKQIKNTRKKKEVRRGGVERERKNSKVTRLATIRSILYCTKAAAACLM